MARILFADDQQIEVNPYIRRLRRHGHIVDQSRNAFETIECLKHAIPDAIQLLVLDISMPGEPLERMLKRGLSEIIPAVRRSVVMGASVYKEVRQMFPDVNIIIFSAMTKTEVEERLFEVKFDCPFLTKGFHTPERVYELIERFI